MSPPISVRTGDIYRACQAREHACMTVLQHASSVCNFKTDRGALSIIPVIYLSDPLPRGNSKISSARARPLSTQILAGDNIVPFVRHVRARARHRARLWHVRMRVMTPWRAHSGGGKIGPVVLWVCEG